MVTRSPRRATGLFWMRTMSRACAWSSSGASGGLPTKLPSQQAFVVQQARDKKKRSRSFSF
jgi:hypothetical protein